MKQKSIAALFLAVLLLSLCACVVTPATPTTTTEPTTPYAPATDPTTVPTLPPTPPPSTRPSATEPVLPTDEEYLAQMTAALTASLPERSVSVVRYVTAKGLTLTSVFTYTASDDRTVYEKQRLRELSAEGFGDMVETERGSYEGHGTSPDEGIILSDLSFEAAYFSELSFADGENTVTMDAVVRDADMISVFGRVPSGGTDFHLSATLCDGRITTLRLSYRIAGANVSVQSDFTY